jgi:CheY-like chemotaxis protein
LAAEAREPIPAGVVAPLAERAAAKAAVSRPRRRRVLVVEDNPDAAQSLREALELFGHEIAVVYDGHEALRRARDLKPEVVLCDIGIPGLDGYGVARAVREDDSLASPFLVALTGYARPEDRQRAKDAGFQCHLAKPPDVEAINRILDGCCGAERGANATVNP